MGDEEVGGGQLACFNTFLHLLLHMCRGSLCQIEDQLCIQYRPIDIRPIDGEYNDDKQPTQGVTAILVFLPPSRPEV